MRENLVRALRDQFEREMENGRQRIADGIAPYLRFVRSEHARLTEARATLEAIKRDVEGLRDRIETPVAG